MHALLTPILQLFSSGTRAGRAVISRPVEKLALVRSSKDRSVESLGGHQGPPLLLGSAVIGGGRAQRKLLVGPSFIDNEKCRGRCPSSQSVARRPLPHPTNHCRRQSSPFTPAAFHIGPRERSDRPGISTASLLASEGPCHRHLCNPTCL